MAINVKFLKGTAEGFAALTKDVNTFYFVDEKDLYLGEIKLSNASDLATAVERIAQNETDIEDIQEQLKSLIGEDGAGTVQDMIDDSIADVTTTIGTVPEGQTIMEIINNIQENAYDDTAIKADIKANTDAIAVLNGDAEGSVAKAVADAKALVDADVEAVEDRLDAIENADTGILAQSKEYTDETVEDAVAAVKASLASALTYKGQKATEAELPTEDNVCGDVWNVVTTDEGTSAEFVWVVDDADAGTGYWEELGTALDLSAYAEKEQVATDISTAVSTAKTELEGKITAEETRATDAEEALAARLDDVEAALGTGEGSVDQQITDAVTETKEYADTQDEATLASAKEYADGLADDYATAEQGAKADTAVQEVTSGTENGTVAVDGTDVSVTGLKSAAYAETTAFDAAGSAAAVQTALESALTWGEF